MSISGKSTKTSYVGPLSPEYALLGLLSLRHAHGYELHQRLKKELGEVWHISLSQTYNILNRLETQGFAESSLQEQEKLPARRTFTLTTAGYQRFDNWLNSPGGCSVRAVRVEFITRLYFALAVNPGLAKKIIDVQEAEIRDGLVRLQEKHARTPDEVIFNRLGLELRIRQLESILNWLDECRHVIEPSYSKNVAPKAAPTADSSPRISV